MHRRHVNQLWILLTALLLIGGLRAEKLVLVEAPKFVNAEKLLDEQPETIFYESRFLLTLQPDEWTPGSAEETVLDTWQPDLFYFVLYPLRKAEIGALEAYGRILAQRSDYLIFRSEMAVLNDFEAFHPFQLVRLSNRKVRRTKSASIHPTGENLLVNTAIQQMVNNVEADTIWKYISVLQGMERYTQNPQAINAANYLKNFYQVLGFDTVYFHTWQGGSIPNVVAVKYGRQYPDEIYLVGGHYDVYTNGAPGADDDGSGTAAIMEMARVMAGLEYKRTLKFVNFSGEELGLLGSAAYAQQAAQQGDNILGMINMDMIAYVQPGDPIDVDVVKNTASLDLFNAYQIYSNTYVPSLSIVNGSLPFGASSDHASFWNNGFKAIFPFEDSDHYSPYIHTSQDVLGVSANNQTLARLGTQSVVATLASLAEIAVTRVNGHVLAASNLSPLAGAMVEVAGDTLFTDLQGYYESGELTPGAYQIIFSATGYQADTASTTLQQYQVQTVDAYLIETGNMRPYLHLQSITVDDDSTGGSLGNGNGVADAGETVEISGLFFNAGNQPAQQAVARAQTSSSWVNLLVDSLVIGPIAPGATVPALTPLLLQIDPATPANTVASFNLTLNYAGYSSSSSFDLTIHNRGQFLIVVDDDGAGGTSVYTDALTALGLTYDVGSPATPFSDMQEYEAMIWFCGEDWSSTLEPGDQQKLTDYLNGGGRLFISGDDIGYDIHNDPFYSNYLKANYIGDGPYSTTTTVFGVSGDPISGQFSTGMAINDNYVDQISPLGGADQIFSYTYQNNTYGCGLKYNGGYQLVYLTFAFENVPGSSDRQNLMHNIAEWFGIVTNLDDPETPISQTFELHQNYPNPFNSETSIRFLLPVRQPVTLEIFDILGRRVRTLINRQMNPGNHQVNWDSRNEKGTIVASGLYIYRLKTPKGAQNKKMLMVR